MPASPPPGNHESHAATPVELFFDLVFVFAVSQLSHHLGAHLSLRSAAETLVMFSAVFTVWSYTSWVATMTQADRAAMRTMILVVMLPGLFMNAAIARAFDHAAWVFVVPMLGIQLGRTTWTIRVAPTPAYRGHFIRVLVWLIATAPLWIVGAATDASTRLVL